MKTHGKDTGDHPSQKVTEEGWLEKKQDLLKRLSRDRDPLKVDGENITRERLLSEVERLEEENHIMTKSVKDFELQFSKRRKKYQNLYKRSDELKEKLVGFLAREHNLLNEIELCESEKAELSDNYSDVSEGLKANISALENTANDIGFMKGEVQAFMEKMEVLESEVPMKFRDMNNLEKKITGSIKALRDLHDRMQGVERNVKISYYKKRK